MGSKKNLRLVGWFLCANPLVLTKHPQISGFSCLLWPFGWKKSQVLHTFAARVPCVCCCLKAESCPLKNEKKNTSSFCKIPSPLQQTNKNLRKSMKHLVFWSLLLVFYFHSGRIPGKIKVGFHHPNRPNNGTCLLFHFTSSFFCEVGT